MISISVAQLWSAFWSSFGLSFCVISGLIVEFEIMSHAPCNAPNYLPSLSTAIGKVKPQVYLWRMVTYFVMGFRFMAGVCYFHWFSGVDVGRVKGLYQTIVRFAALFYFMELSALLALSAISVKDDGAKHEQLFRSFLFMAQLYMILTIIAVTWTHKCGAFVPTKMERRMLYARILLFLFNAFCAREVWVVYDNKVLACVPYGYTWFATFEYLATVCNILYHAISSFDLRRYSFTFVQTSDIRRGPLKNIRDPDKSALRV